MKIVLSRHGESVYNTKNMLGGDSSLTQNGINYATNLGNFIEKTDWFPRKCICSTKKRVQETFDIIKDKMKTVVSTNELNELNAGICENLTYTEFYQFYPNEFTQRYKNKLTYKYPEGESYIDLIKRVENIAQDIKKENEDVFIISHQAITRALMVHFITELDINQVPHIDIPLNTLIVLENGKQIDLIPL
jgi:broad specificity phosphatase PhoE